MKTAFVSFSFAQNLLPKMLFSGGNDSFATVTEVRIAKLVVTIKPLNLGKKGISQGF